MRTADGEATIDAEKLLRGRGATPMTAAARTRRRHARSGACKMPLGNFLSGNPFPEPLTLGFFYREKMRAIHRIAPEERLEHIVELGGGRSGLTASLYHHAQVTNVDIDPAFAHAPPNRQARMSYVCGDATAVPLPNASADAVTMFDVLEHVPDDAAAAAEALRVLRPGGVLMISTPNEQWRFPYYRFMRGICPSEAEMFAEWGHVRRGYSLEELRALIGLPCERSATFITPITVLCHDIAFSRLPQRARRAGCVLLGPLTWLGYTAHRAGARGTETASAWRKL